MGCKSRSQIEGIETKEFVEMSIALVKRCKSRSQIEGIETFVVLVRDRIGNTQVAKADPRLRGLKRPEHECQVSIFCNMLQKQIPD